MNQEINQLWEVQFRVRPTPSHPRYYEIQFARLHIWVFSDLNSIEVAMKRANEIAKLLPYELGDGKIFPVIEDKIAPEHRGCIANAHIIGANIALMYWPIGTDEATTLGHWPYLVPPLGN